MKLSTILFLAVLSGADMQAQTLQSAPRLVVNITVDQLRTDFMVMAVFANCSNMAVCMRLRAILLRL